MTSADLSNDDRYLVVGCGNSCIRIVDLQTFTTVKVIRLFKKEKPITQIQFSNNEMENVMLVVSSQSKKVFTIKVSEESQNVQGKIH